MSHQPYETWILDALPLDTAQARQLEAHLQSCEDCRKLRVGWTAAQVALSRTEMAAPRIGFRGRWKASLVERRQREQRRQAWKLFVACSGTAAVMLVFLVAYVAVSTTPVQWIQAGVKAVTSSTGFVTTLRDVSATWAQVVPPGLTLVFWFAVTVTVLLLIGVWVFALWRTSLGGVIQK